MEISQRPLRICLLLTASILSVSAFSHGDTDKPLYVSESGTDNGDCIIERAPCATIGYALSRAGKGSQLRVMEGYFEIEDAEDVFHLVSGVVDVSGGFRAGNKSQIAARGVSQLSGVPYQYREALKARGFSVLSDSKGSDNAKASRTNELLGIHQQLKSSIAATPCVGGNAAGLPCTDVDLLSHVGFVDISVTPNSGNDVWGFVDLNTRREYAIAGFNLGTGIFDVTDAENPLEVGFIDGQNAVWRDIKVYQFFDAVEERWKAYAYITTDGSTDGIFIIDLTDLPHSISRVNYPSDITRAHNIYATNTDFSTGLSLTSDLPSLVIAGSSFGIGNYRTYGLTNPESPSLINGGAGIGYMHDAASILITDSRKDTQCVNGGANCQLLLDFNENSFEIWDVTNAASPVRLSNTPYPNASYVHSGWWSEDKQFIFVHDETDERDFQLPTTLRTFSVADLTSPVLAGTWSGSTNAIDHNGFVRGNRYYMSNYSRGLTVLDITDPTSAVEVGRLDTYPASDGTLFVGAWGAYPFFHSGNIAISDIDSGFYMAADQTRDVVEGKLEFTSRSFTADEGQQLSLTVQRGVGSTGAVSVDYEILNATTADDDHTISSGALTWANGDSASKFITIDATNDGISEGLEHMLVRLINPTGGATLGNLNTTSAYISDPGATSEINFTSSGAAAAERGFATVVAVLKRSGSAVGAASVDIGMVSNATPGADFLGGSATTINWAAGDGDPKTIVLSLIDDGIVEDEETIGMSLNNPVNTTIGPLRNFTATILDGSGANSIPVSIAGASQSVSAGAIVTLDGNQSNDPNNDSLTFAWSQTSGPNVFLNNANSAITTFSAPSLTSDSMLQFQLTVADPGGLSASASTTVTVARTVAPPESGGGGGAISLYWLITFGAMGVRRRIERNST
jgi:choice-of-anchor B domain-containing protein